MGVTGRDIKALEGEAQHGVGIAPQGPLAAGEGWVGAVGETRRGEASPFSPSGVQGECASVCGKQRRRSRAGQSQAGVAGPATQSRTGDAPGAGLSKVPQDAMGPGETRK